MGTPIQDITTFQTNAQIFSNFLSADADTEVDFSQAQDGSDMQPSLAMLIANLGCHPAAGGSVAAVQTNAPGSVTYSNGAGGVGATVTAGENGAMGAALIDGVAPALGMRVWWTFPNNEEWAGIYTITALGDAGDPWVITRATDADSAADLGYLFAYVTGGATLAGTAQMFPVSAAGITVGTTNLPTVVVSGSAAVAAETARAEGAEAAITALSPSQSASFTLTAEYRTWIVDDSGGDIVVTVPPGAGFADQEWVVLKSKNTANTVTLTMSGAEKLNGASTFVLAAQFNKVWFQNSNGSTTWYVLGS